ncbi:DUF1127 domain-containing protein [Shimia ponticola]|uniref:DUF1127 domain-containing protein n=1 Tax=Shimia ponticola TaxID=2582893 RepID=UPI002107AB12|nr:DUF1127 domain-containing protein [Shimia ponticola]
MTTQTLNTNLLITLNKQAKLPFAATIFLYAAVVLTQWAQLYRSRQDLRDLDSHLLRDIGISPEDAEREARRPFWQG